MNTLKHQLDLHTRLFNNVLDGFADSETQNRANDQVNHLKWLAGHLTSTRFGFKDLAQLGEADPYGDLFGHGKALDPAGDYPDIASIKANWNRISEKISAAFGQLSPEILEADALKVPIGNGKMGEFLDFLMHHEAYHLGQMGLLRKYLGQPAMSYA